MTVKELMEMLDRFDPDTLVLEPAASTDKQGFDRIEGVTLLRVRKAHDIDRRRDALPDPEAPFGEFVKNAPVLELTDHLGQPAVIVGWFKTPRR